MNPRLTQRAMIALENRSDVYEMDAADCEREIAGRISLLRSLRPSVPRGGRLLDVGCNRGLLLEAALRLGWEPVGVELAPTVAARARLATGVAVYEALSEVPRGRGFDLIVAWHVLEHTVAPVAFLGHLGTLLAPHGVMALQVPSFDFVDVFERQGRMSSLVCAVHNLCLTEATLSDILNRAGFGTRALINSDSDLMLTAFVGLSRWGYLRNRALARWALGGRPLGR